MAVLNHRAFDSLRGCAGAQVKAVALRADPAPIDPFPRLQLMHQPLVQGKNRMLQGLCRPMRCVMAIVGMTVAPLTLLAQTSLHPETLPQTPLQQAQPLQTRPPALPPARLPARRPAYLQAQLDTALLAHAAGRMRQAQRLFERLALQQVPAAQYSLAVMHLNHDMPGADLRSARRWLERAARAGFVTAQHDLGQALEAGTWGRPNLVLAHDWYERAAVAGSAAAQLAMGTAHYLGRGRPRDGARAAHWFREAAKAGDVGAMYLLASMYEKGEGLDTDLRLARYWYEKAAAQGDEAAPGKLIEVDKRLQALE